MAILPVFGKELVVRRKTPLLGKGGAAPIKKSRSLLSGRRRAGEARKPDRAQPSRNGSFNQQLIFWTVSPALMRLNKVLTALLLPLIFATAASAQSNWVGQFLNRYRPPAIDPASRVTPQVSDAPWRLMVQQGVLPVSVSDVI